MTGKLVDQMRSEISGMNGHWKIFLTGSAIGAVLGSYVVARMRGNGTHTMMSVHDQRSNRSKLTETVAGLASQAADKMDDLSLRARTLNSRMNTRQ